MRTAWEPIFGVYALMASFVAGGSASWCGRCARAR